MQEETINRNKEMIKLRENGYTLGELAKKYNLSRQRINQIVGSINPPNHEYRGKYPQFNPEIIGKDYYGDDIKPNSIIYMIEEIKNGKLKPLKPAISYFRSGKNKKPHWLSEDTNGSRTGLQYVTEDYVIEKNLYKFVKDMEKSQEKTFDLMEYCTTTHYQFDINSQII